MDSRSDCLQIPGGNHLVLYHSNGAKAMMSFSEDDLGLVRQLLKGNPQIQRASPISHQKQIQNKKLISSKVHKLISLQ
jgi:hypothetical protein